MGMTYGETSEVKPNLVELYERELDRYYRLLVEFSLAVENAVKTGSETRGYFYDWITRHIEGEIGIVRTHLTTISGLKAVWIEVMTENVNAEKREFFSIIGLVGGYLKEIETRHQLFRDHFEGFSQSLNKPVAQKIDLSTAVKNNYPIDTQPAPRSVLIDPVMDEMTEINIKILEELNSPQNQEETELPELIETKEDYILIKVGHHRIKIWWIGSDENIHVTCTPYDGNGQHHLCTDRKDLVKVVYEFLNTYDLESTIGLYGIYLQSQLLVSGSFCLSRLPYHTLTQGKLSDLDQILMSLFSDFMKCLGADSKKLRTQIKESRSTGLGDRYLTLKTSDFEVIVRPTKSCYRANIAFSRKGVMSNTIGAADEDVFRERLCDVLDESTPTCPITATIQYLTKGPYKNVGTFTRENGKVIRMGPFMKWIGTIWWELFSVKEIKQEQPKNQPPPLIKEGVMPDRTTSAVCMASYAGRLLNESKCKLDSELSTYVDRLVLINVDTKFVITRAIRDPSLVHIEIYNKRFYERTLFNMDKELFLKACTEEPGLVHSESNVVLYYIQGPSRDSYYAYEFLRKGEDNKIIRSGHSGSDYWLGNVWDYFFNKKNATPKDNWILIKFNDSQIELVRDDYQWRMMGCVCSDEKSPACLKVSQTSLPEFLGTIKGMILATKPKSVKITTAKECMEIYTSSKVHDMSNLNGISENLTKLWNEIEKQEASSN